MVAVEDHGSIVLLRPLSAEAEEWLRENCATEDWQWFGGALAVEHRYAGEIVNALIEEGYCHG